MAPRNVYQDEEALGKMLDNLLLTAQGDVSEKPHRTNSVILTEDNFSPLNVRESMSVTNEILQKGKVCNMLSNLDADASNVMHVLASALSAIVKLSRCCDANKKLRIEAEDANRDENARTESADRLHEGAKYKISRLNSQIFSMGNAASESKKKTKNTMLKLSSECGALKTKLANATYRLNHFSMEMKKREMEYTQLQQRVHSLMAKTKRLSIEPQITATSCSRARVSPSLSREDSLEKEQDAFENLIGQFEDQYVNDLVHENSSFRDLTCAVQEELEDLVLLTSSSIHSTEKTANFDENLTACPYSSPDGRPNNIEDKHDIAESSSEQRLLGASGTPERIGTQSLPSGQIGADCVSLTTPTTSPSLTKAESKTEEQIAPRTEAKSIGSEVKPDEESGNTGEPRIRDSSGIEGHSDGETEAIGHQNVASGPTVEQMRLPFEIIRPELEKHFEQMFELVRQALLAKRGPFQHNSQAPKRTISRAR